MESQTCALIGVAITVALFLLGGAFALGKLFQRVETNTAELGRIATEVSQLSADVRRTNEVVIALASPGMMSIEAISFLEESEQVGLRLDQQG